jgi:hypothetical protein
MRCFYVVWLPDILWYLSPFTTKFIPHRPTALQKVIRCRHTTRPGFHRSKKSRFISIKIRMELDGLCQVLLFRRDKKCRGRHATKFSASPVVKPTEIAFSFQYWTCCGLSIVGIALLSTSPGRGRRLDQFDPLLGALPVLIIA